MHHTGPLGSSYVSFVNTFLYMMHIRNISTLNIVFTIMSNRPTLSHYTGLYQFTFLLKYLYTIIYTIIALDAQRVFRYVYIQFCIL